MPIKAPAQSVKAVRERVVRRHPIILAATLTPASALAVWVLARPFAGFDVRLGSGSNREHVGPLNVAIVSVLVALAASTVRALLGRLAPNNAGRAWVPLCLIVLAVSVAGPLGGGTTTATKLALISVHLAVAAVVIPALATSQGRPFKEPPTPGLTPNLGQIPLGND